MERPSLNVKSMFCLLSERRLWREVMNNECTKDSVSKKGIYLDIYHSSMQQIRSVSTGGLLTKCFDRSVFYEAQLIHKFGLLLKYEHFDDADIDFLNWGARSYYECCDIKKSCLYNEQLNRFSMLFSSVPEEMRHKLEWNGPGLSMANE